MSQKVYKYDSKISSARKNSKSGRTTIPKQIMDMLDLEIGDEIEWDLSFPKGYPRVTIVKKLK